MRNGLLVIGGLLAVVAVAAAAGGASSEPELDENGAIMRQSLESAGIPSERCDQAWGAYQAARENGASEPQAFAAALATLTPTEAASVWATYAALHGGTATNPTPTPNPQPQPQPQPQPGPTTPKGPAVLVAQTETPAGGWSGGRAILARDIPIADWITSNGWPEGAKENDGRGERSDYLVPGYGWFPRDRLAQEWDKQGLVVFSGWTWIPLASGRDVLEVEISDSVALLGGDVRLTISMLGAQAIADRHGCILPTAAMVDQCWKLKAQTLPDSPLVPNPVPAVNMCSVAASLLEDTRVFPHFRPAMKGIAATWGKEYTLTPALAHNPDVSNIYGWHRADGTVWQSPGSGGGSVHPARYFDYSHTFRLVKPVARLNGTQVALPPLYTARPDLVGGTRFGNQPCPLRQPLVVHRAPDGSIISP